MYLEHSLDAKSDKKESNLITTQLDLGRISVVSQSYHARITFGSRLSY